MRQILEKYSEIVFQKSECAELKPDGIAIIQVNALAGSQFCISLSTELAKDNSLRKNCLEFIAELTHFRKSNLYAPAIFVDQKNFKEIGPANYTVFGSRNSSQSLDFTICARKLLEAKLHGEMRVKGMGENETLNPRAVNQRRRGQLLCEAEGFPIPEIHWKFRDCIKENEECDEDWDLHSCDHKLMCKNISSKTIGANRVSCMLFSNVIKLSLNYQRLF